MHTFATKRVWILFFLFSVHLIFANPFPLIEKIHVTQNTITIIPGAHFKKAHLSDDFFIEYFNQEIDLRTFDDSILIMPFVFDVLSTIFASGETYSVDCLDEEVCNSFEQIREIWKCLYPETNWSGALTCKKKVKHSFQFNSNTIMLLYSGGVDSTYSSIKHADKKQHLFTLKGHVDSKTPQQWSSFCEVREAFTTMMNHSFSSAFSHSPYIIRCDYPWRAKTLGNLRMIGKVLPLMIFYQISQLYVPSTVTWDYPFKYHSPRVDNSIRFGDCIRVQQDAADCPRCKKIEFLLTYFNEHSIVKWPLKVCLKSSSRKNCNNCHKCTRTISDLYLCGVDPNNFGFNTTIERTKNHISKYLHQLNTNCPHYDIEAQLELFCFNESLKYIEQNNRIDHNEYSQWFYKTLMQQPCIQYIRSLPKQPCFSP